MLELIQKIRNRINKIYFIFLYKSSFLFFGRKSTICFPFQVDGAKYIYIDDKVHIHRDCWLLALKTQDYTPELKINSNTYIGRFAHIVCVDKLLIHSNVLISDKVYISDNLHSYQDINIPIKDQPIISRGKVEIGENTWIGENVSVIASSIGMHCVIGANSVVLDDIPDYSLAVGSPAKVIKQYNKSTNLWERIDNV